MPRTRLAPSPTGALHLGNARTFMVTWALARQRGWKVLLRIEDLDGPRVKAGAIESTIDILKWLGMDWDEGPVIQSDDLAPYRKAMNRLAGAALAYPSAMTRAEIEAAASAPQEGVHETPFPASLRPLLAPRAFDDENTNWRFVTPPGEVRFDDTFAGPSSFDPSTSVGDFPIWTKRAQPSYQLAVMVDDHRQGITDIIRGNDLLDSAARQLLLYRFLGYTPEPSYAHLPLIRGHDGRRLAKRHGDTRIDTYRATGVPRDRLLGLLAFWSGIRPQRAPITPADFVRGIDLRTIPPLDQTFTQEDDRWLRSDHA